MCSSGSLCKNFVYFILVVTDIADFISDWLFFVDVYIVEEGLVYGPVQPAAKWSLLAFSIVGTITFIMEMTNLWWETFRHNAWVDSDALSAVVIWIEDVPQIAISLYIATCREEPISIFQLSKAAVVLIGIVVRIIVSSVKYCNKKAVRSHHHVKYKVVIMLGIILEAFCAGAIFFLTQTEKGETGTVSFKVPTTIIEEKFNDQRYFANVSIFLHQADLFDAGNLDLDKTDEIFNWMRLTSINKVRQPENNREAFFSFDSEPRSAQVTKFAVWEWGNTMGGHSNQWTLSECYDIDQQTADITTVAKTTCEQPNYFINPYRVYVKFKYDPPGSVFKKKVFGDIYFNMRQQTGASGACEQVRDYTSSISASVGGKYPITMHYFRTGALVQAQGTKHLLHGDGTMAPKFFRNDDMDLEEIRSIWRTGWNKCKSTGSVAPNWDEELEVECNRP